MSKRYEFIEMAFENFYNSEATKINKIYNDISGDFLKKERTELMKLIISSNSILGDMLVSAFEKERMEYVHSKWQYINENLPSLEYKYSKEEEAKIVANSSSASWNTKSIAPMAVGGAAGAAVIGGCIIADVAKPILIAGGIVGVLLFVGGICIGYYIYNSKSKSIDANASKKVIILAKEENLSRLRAFVDKAKEITYSCVEEE